MVPLIDLALQLIASGQQGRIGRHVRRHHAGKARPELIGGNFEPTERFILDKVHQQGMHR